MTHQQLRSFVLNFALVGGLSAGLAGAQAAPQQPAPAPAPAPTPQQPAPGPVQAPTQPAQQPPVTRPPATPPTAKPATPAAPAGQKPATTTQEVVLPAGYVIGPDDVLAILYRYEKDMAAEVTVRPDGVISLPLLNEIHVSGMTPEELRARITKDAMKFLVDEPTVSVIVKAINSRKVYITGGVGKPGFYNLSGPTTVVQLIAMAGGVAEFSNSKNILIVRTVAGKPTSMKFNYKDFSKGRNLKQNIELLPGDSVIVP